jgi:hypothetical protein
MFSDWSGYMEGLKQELIKDKAAGQMKAADE